MFGSVTFFEFRFDLFHLSVLFRKCFPVGKVKLQARFSLVANSIECFTFFQLYFRNAIFWADILLGFYAEFILYMEFSRIEIVGGLNFTFVSSFILKLY